MDTSKDHLSITQTAHASRLNETTRYPMTPYFQEAIAALKAHIETLKTQKPANWVVRSHETFHAINALEDLSLRMNLSEMPKTELA